MSGENRDVAELIVSQQVFGRPFLAPPGTAQEPLGILRTAFMAAMTDEALLAEAMKMNLDINPRNGETIATLVKKVYASPPAMIEKMKRRCGRSSIFQGAKHSSPRERTYVFVQSSWMFAARTTFVQRSISFGR
jgi:hypothetical protein